MERADVVNLLDKYTFALYLSDSDLMVGQPTLYREEHGEFASLLQPIRWKIPIPFTVSLQMALLRLAIENKMKALELHLDTILQVVDVYQGNRGIYIVYDCIASGMYRVFM